MTRDTLSVQPGRCAYCGTNQAETVQVTVIVRGSSPPHGLRMCLPHASQYAVTCHAAPELAAQVARLWRTREENSR
jgi:hypothetical protein